jgi:hypothetical protein
MEDGGESKPSSVLDGHLSRPPKGPATSSPSWRLSTSGLGEQPASGRFGDCCGEDCPFHPGKPVLVSVALARRTARQSGLSTAGFPAASLAFTRHPRSVQLGLSSDAEAPATILAHPGPRLLTCFPGVSGLGFRVTGDSNSPTPVTRNPTPPSVPKGRFELPRGYPHYALNVARLPVPPLRPVLCPPSRGPEPTSGLEPETCCLRNSCSTN